MNDGIERVTGIGGIFFRVRDPAFMAAWYQKNLGVASQEGHADFLWRDAEQTGPEGRTVWSLFPADSDYFGPARPAFMINYRVQNMDRMLTQLRRNGVAVEKAEDYDYGRFAGFRIRKAIESNYGSRKRIDDENKQNGCPDQQQFKLAED